MLFKPIQLKKTRKKAIETAENKLLFKRYADKTPTENSCLRRFSAFPHLKYTCKTPLGTILNSVLDVLFAKYSVV